ncbi:MAG: hypothetical protein AAF213_10385 [Pseudomonadota bacterium]
MAKNRYQQAAERLKKAASLGPVRKPPVPPPHVSPHVSPQSRHQLGSRSPVAPPASGPLTPAAHHQPHDPLFAPPPQGPGHGGRPVEHHHHYHQPSHHYRLRPVRTGFGLGLGFAAGGALFRLVFFLIGVVLLFAFLNAGLAMIGF